MDVAGGGEEVEEVEAVDGGEQQPPMEIGWPTDVRHVAHVTFDRFHGFQGLPVELQPEVAGNAPSASKTVFGVSTESMQCSLCARLPAAKAALLDWAVQLMADVAREERSNKMGSRNVAMVFAPNMTHAMDPFTALKHAVHVMNFLTMLIDRALNDVQTCNN
ncbi:hypothetical protein OsJ_04895 [Oryza sativa Japonica Group]|uniref:CRIB domain-containing protein n=1 Tax=Oryza sativa subsp. japonica TaxID=39947 RepID=B9EWX7_ORYSJ|nr:hypothetical protein OsJ_04895 [Oryza sativa Japonica Group]